MVIVDESNKNICNYVICTQKCDVGNLNSMCIMRCGCVTISSWLGRITTANLLFSGYTRWPSLKKSLLCTIQMYQLLMEEQRMSYDTSQ